MKTKRKYSVVCSVALRRKKTHILKKMLGSEKWASQSMIDEHGCRAALCCNLDFKTEGWCWLHKYLYMSDVCLSHTYTGIVQLNPGKYLVYSLILLPYPWVVRKASGAAMRAASPLWPVSWPLENERLPFSTRDDLMSSSFYQRGECGNSTHLALMLVSGLHHLQNFPPLGWPHGRSGSYPGCRHLGRAQCSLEGDFILLGDAGRPPLSAFSLPYG